MRTTLDIDDDLLVEIKEIANRQSKSAGAVASDLIRQSLTTGHREGFDDSADEFEAKFGFRPFANSHGVVTDEIVNRLREETADL